MSRSSNISVPCMALMWPTLRSTSCAPITRVGAPTRCTDPITTTTMSLSRLVVVIVKVRLVVIVNGS